MVLLDRLNLFLTGPTNQTTNDGRWLLFKTPITGKGLVFLSLSMCGGFLYTFTKIKEARQRQQPLSALPR